ncbi:MULTISPECIES: universal stress protein [Leptolyngbya]|jgi:nucleotide-binding universal stress UspA family protein|uniref:UspA domain-containing protein n=2 Tax=Leptolyngbya boryana TaxID=1184 RepID=A0A1Z4JFI4_LEPBY|nr:MULTISPECIES: universal stress protein [Leptolyngbya]BAY55428.1 UspA domain-containing protein [Leptolyngbya boryana NIES-2135]MBD2368420.1 universal stress protein [Leptolyngbya sp. FACHB-161]MBD2374924.1 universal stress protein [Leptolyngbya sp. FACHB-238]MBD2399344.1 universal stress protein [Leptolyngbya sp. FACHB-239]MBD2405549.1 universal stress protein [Leptolyngbya sp. FACHB-402]
MFHRILICTDLTDGLQRLVRFVPQLAQGGIQQITFLHSVPIAADPGMPKPDAAKIERAQAQLAPALEHNLTGIDVQVEVESGKPIEVMLRAVKKHQSDVILMGTQSRNLLTEKLFGSTTVELAQRSPIPILAIRPQLISAMTSEELSLRCQHLFRELLVPYDDSDASKHTIAEIAKRANASPACMICRVLESGHYELSAAEEQQILTETLEPAKAQLQAAGLQAEIELRKGNALTQILQAAQENDISAIALSSNLSDHAFGAIPSFAAELLRQSMHPILLFPAP